MIPRWQLRLIYQMFSTPVGWLVLRARSDTSKEIEILVLARQLAGIRPPHRRRAPAARPATRALSPGVDAAR